MTAPPLKLRYFAWVRTRIGRSEEDVAWSPETATAGALVRHLAARGGGYAEAFVKPELVRIAVDHAFVGNDHVLEPGQEIGLFPPVTGG